MFLSFCPASGQSWTQPEYSQSTAKVQPRRDTSLRVLQNTAGGFGGRQPLGAGAPPGCDGGGVWGGDSPAGASPPNKTNNNNIYIYICF